MDAVNFLQEKDRMCRANGCKECSLLVLCNGKHLSCSNFCEKYPQLAIPLVEKWSEEHPANTRMSKFFEQYPNAPINDDGLPMIPPCNIEKSYNDQACSCDCEECCKKYWYEVIK